MIHAFASILVDHGHLRSVVVDLQREVYHLVPKELGNYIEHLRIAGTNTIDDIDSEFKDFLEEHELVFSLDPNEAHRYPTLDLTWYSPSVISNCVVQIRQGDPEFHIRVQDLVEKLGCTRLLLVAEEPISVADLQGLLSNYDNSIARSIDVMSRYTPGDVESIQGLIDKYPRLRSWVMYDAPEDKEMYQGPAGFGYVMSFTGGLDLFSDHSFVDPAYFKSNIALYTESQRHHSYFNAKLYIRSDGAILNAPNSLAVVGHLESLVTGPLRELAMHPVLTKFWFVTKARTDVCKDCEFRNMCVDSRPPVARNPDEYFHAHECTYNPYVCKWKGEEGYRTLAECGVVSNAEGFSIDHERIAAINAELWGE